ncbi:hypothetical protein RJT34_31864 [Clitoria ternatea]|uniref:Uncharacterized protein n=1 Tax=Clitoria ternatea TaxID=43366 RepID=A0AAN9F2U8_CLITE
MSVIGIFGILYGGILGAFSSNMVPYFVYLSIVGINVPIRGVTLYGLGRRGCNNYNNLQDNLILISLFVLVCETSLFYPLLYRVLEMI